MKRTVTISVTVDPEEYLQAEDTAQGAVDIAIDCLRNEADWDCSATVECKGLPGEKGVRTTITLK